MDKPRIGHPLCTGLCYGTASVSDDQSGISSLSSDGEAKADLEKEGKLPVAVSACVGGGSSNAMGMFYEFIPKRKL